MGKRIKIFIRILPAMAIIFFILTGALSCGRKELPNDHDVARQLFEKSVRMIAVYIDSVGQVPDSASLQSLVDNFNTKITTLNFEFPSNTDFDLNEDENDSLIRMHKRWIRTVQLRDSIIMHPTDSLKTVAPKDSLKRVVKKSISPIKNYSDSLKAE
ncbi:MAG: hypothetical protein K2I44_00845 [Muribaculaceae bacterium]|nr:hypothetical protein [Muribaculaceae bacterium]